MCQDPTIVAVEYLKVHVLPADFERNIRDLGLLADSGKTKRWISSLVKNVALEMPPALKTGAGINLARRKIVLPYGFLGERWCSTYRTFGLLKGAAGFEAFESAGPTGDRFTWPNGMPTPENSSKVVATVNKIFPYVILATVLHEVGHIVYRQRRLFGPRLELACDGFAMDYFRRTKRVEHRQILTLALSVWMCCLCSESLMYTEHVGRSHPSPARRMEHFFGRYMGRFHGRSMGAIRFLCVGHLINLARIRREDVAQEIINRDYFSCIARVHALRKCWGPRA